MLSNFPHSKQNAGTTSLVGSETILSNYSRSSRVFYPVSFHVILCLLISFSYSLVGISCSASSGSGAFTENPEPPVLPRIFVLAPSEFFGIKFRKTPWYGGVKGSKDDNRIDKSLVFAYDSPKYTQNPLLNDLEILQIVPEYVIGSNPGGPSPYWVEVRKVGDGSKGFLPLDKLRLKENIATPLDPKILNNNIPVLVKFDARLSNGKMPEVQGMRFREKPFFAHEELRQPKDQNIVKDAYARHDKDVLEILRLVPEQYPDGYGKTGPTFYIWAEVRRRELVQGQHQGKVGTYTIPKKKLPDGNEVELRGYIPLTKLRFKDGNFHFREGIIDPVMLVEEFGIPYGGIGGANDDIGKMLFLAYVDTERRMREAWEVSQKAKKITQGSSQGGSGPSDGPSSYQTGLDRPAYIPWKNWSRSFNLFKTHFQWYQSIMDEAEFLDFAGNFLLDMMERAGPTCILNKNKINDKIWTDILVFLETLFYSDSKEETKLCKDLLNFSAHGKRYPLLFGAVRQLNKYAVGQLLNLHKEIYRYNIYVNGIDSVDSNIDDLFVDDVEEIYSYGSSSASASVSTSVSALDVGMSSIKIGRKIGIMDVLNQISYDIFHDSTRGRESGGFSAFSRQEKIREIDDLIEQHRHEISRILISTLKDEEEKIERREEFQAEIERRDLQREAEAIAWSESLREEALREEALRTAKESKISTNRHFSPVVNVFPIKKTY